MITLVRKGIMLSAIVFISCNPSINSQITTNETNNVTKEEVITFNIFKDQSFRDIWEKKTIEAVETSILLKQFNDNPSYLYLWIEHLETKDIPVTNNRKPLMEYFSNVENSIKLKELVLIELILALQTTTIRDIVIGISESDSIVFLFDYNQNNVIKEKKIKHLNLEEILDSFYYKNCDSEDVMIISRITTDDINVNFIANLCEKDYLLAKKILE